MLGLSFLFFAGFTSDFLCLFFIKCVDSCLNVFICQEVFVSCFHSVHNAVWSHFDDTVRSSVDELVIV